LNELDARKKALAAEADVFRQTLKLELQNLRLCALQASRSMTGLRLSNPVVMLTATVAGSLLRNRRFGLMRLVTAALVGWQLYQRVLSPLRGLFPGRMRRTARRIPQAEDRTPTANI